MHQTGQGVSTRSQQLHEVGRLEDRKAGLGLVGAVGLPFLHGGCGHPANLPEQRGKSGRAAILLHRHGDRNAEFGKDG